MSITYELAKELKDAGFPQNILGKVDDWVVRMPSLFELIESCGDNFDYLERGTQGGWYAYHENFGATEEESCDDSGHGSSPEEAVARLWLALNKK